VRLSSGASTHTKESLNPETTKNDSQRKHGLRGMLRSRWLLGAVLLLVAVIGGKTIHRAMQPKYEGKTVEEWFAAYTLDGALRLDVAEGVPFQKLGTNAVWFLWGEYTRKDSKTTSWLMAHRDRFTGKKRLWWANTHELERQSKALILLRKMGPIAEPLIPEIIPRLTSADLDEAATMAYFLAEINRQPEVVVPAIHRALLSTNWSFGHSKNHIAALGKFGPQARSALPELQNRLGHPAHTNRAETFYLARAILQINGPGPELGVFTNNLVPGDIHKSTSALSYLRDVGTNAWPAVPALREFIKTFTDDSAGMYILDVISEIDPEARQNKP